MADMLEKMRIANLYIGAHGIPVDIIGLARALGIRVYKAPWPGTINGKIQRDPDRGGESGFAIFVNESHPETRQRFTVAHEVAHYILHEDKIGDGILDDVLWRSGLSDEVEKQANNLAADMLMPWQQLQNMLPADIDALAKRFNVSSQAMAIRVGIFG